MLGLNFAYRGNGLSYLGWGAQRLKHLSRARWATAYANSAHLLQPLRSLSTTLKERLRLPLGEAVYLNGVVLFQQAEATNIALRDFNTALFINSNRVLVPFVRRQSG